MADCQEYTRLISAALDGELTPKEQAELDAHLAGCPQCRELMDQLSDLRQALAQLPPVPPPPQLKDHIMAAVAREAAPSRGGGWGKWLACAAVAALVLAAAWRLGLPSPKVDGDATAQNETASVTAETAADDALMDEGGASTAAGAARSSVTAAGGAARAVPTGGDDTTAYDDVAEAVFEDEADRPAQKASADVQVSDTAHVPYAVQISGDGDAPIPTLFLELEPAVYSVSPDAGLLDPYFSDPILPPP